MKISARGQYGMQAMLNLAIQSDRDPVTLSSIADSYGISASYLEQVFSSLRRSGLIKSVKGAQGGYILARQPSHITVGDILKVLEGSLFAASAEEPELSDGADALKHCLKKEVWDKIDNSIKSVIDFITLEDLVKEYYRTRDLLSYMPNL